MASFCAKCGSPMDQNTGVCSKCGWAPANRGGSSANQIPVTRGGANQIPVTGGNANQIPVTRGGANRIPVTGGNANQMPVTGGSANQPGPVTRGDYVRKEEPGVPAVVAGPAEEQKKKSATKVILLAVAAVLVLVCGIVGGMLLGGKSSGTGETVQAESAVEETEATPQVSEPAAPETPLESQPEEAAPQVSEAAAAEAPAEEQPAPEEEVPLPDLGSPTYSLTEIGTFDGQIPESFFYGDFYLSDGEYVNLFDYMGNDTGIDVYEVSDEICDGYLAGRGSDAFDSWGLVDKYGEVLIPFEAAEIQYIDDEHQRYLLVTYVTGETRDEDAYIYWDYGTDLRYEGYFKVFDMENLDFVPGVEPDTTSSWDVCCVGDLIVVDGDSGISHVYDCNGNVVLETKNSLYCGEDIFLEYESGTYRVYDGSSGEITYTSKRSLWPVNGRGGYITEAQDDSSHLLKDRWGNTVIEEAYDDFRAVQYGTVLIKDNGQYGLLSLDGTVLLPCQYGDYVMHAGYGFWYLDDGKEYILIRPDGQQINLGDSYPYDLVIERDSDKGTDVLVLDEGLFSLELEDNYPQTPVIGLVISERHSDYMYGVFETFGGEQLLPYEYEEIFYGWCYNCLYCYKNNVWTIYEVNYPDYGE